MASYRPPHHGYGPPPNQDPYARPGSTTYNQQPPAPAPPVAHGYGTPAPMSASWNAPPNQHHHHSHQYSSNPLPPPPPGAPPPASAYNTASYQGQGGAPAGGGYGAPPSLPPRVSQPYGAPSATPPNAAQQPYQAPAYGPPQGASHHRMSSVASTYHQEVSQNAQGWPQHPQYSNQPTTHHYDPPLPPRPGSQGNTNAGADGRRFSLYDKPPAHQGQPQAPALHMGQVPYQQNPQGQNFDPSPSSASQYSPDDPSHPNYQPPVAYQPQGGYVAPPPPPKPQQYDPQPGRPGYAQNEAPPPRPSSVQHAYQQQYSSPPPPNAGYTVSPPGTQYTHDQTNQHPSYPGTQARPAQQGPGGYTQHAPAHGPAADYPGQSGYGRHTPSQAPPRPYSNPPVQQGYHRPPPPTDDQPVSPLQSRQSVSFERPGSSDQAPGGPQAGLEPANSKQVAPRPTLAKPSTSFTFSSDWEHFGSGADEIDDTAMYGVKVDESETKLASVELPGEDLPHGRAGSEVSAPESFHPSPASAPAAAVGVHHPGSQPTPPPQNSYAPTPPTGRSSRQSMQPPPPAQQSVPMDEADYIPPMPGTPPAAQRPARGPIVIGGSLRSGQAPSAAPSFAKGSETTQTMQPAAYAMQQALQSQERPPISQKSSQTGAPRADRAAASNEYVAGDGGWQQQRHPELMNGTAPAPAPQVPAIDPAELRQAQQEAGDLRAKLAQLETDLAASRSSIAEKDSLLAQRDSAIVQKDALITQKDGEIAQRTTHLNELQASLAEITEMFTVLKTSTSDLEDKLKGAEAGRTELSAKLEQAQAELATVKKAHVDEKKESDDKLKEAQSSLAAALAEVGGLKKQLEEEKALAEAKAAEPVDIAPGLEPWFKGSLERYKEMLYTESKPIPVQEKLQVFMDVMNAESRLRGIEVPFGPKGEARGFNAPQTQSQPPRTETPKPERPRVTPPKETDGFVMVDSDAEVQYSPGGRPILNAPTEEYSPGGRPILGQSRSSQGQGGLPERPSSNGPADSSQKPAYQPFRGDGPGSGPSTRGPSPARPATTQPSNPAYKPFSWKQGDPSNQGPVAPQTPPQAPVAAPAAQVPVYKPLYKPTPAAAAETSTQVGNSDILIDHVPGMNARVKKDSLKSPQDETMLPLPLKPRGPAPSSSGSSVTAELPATTTPIDANPPVPRGGNAIERLSVLVKADAERQPSKHVQELTKALSAVNTDYVSIKTLTKTWEDKAAATRSQLEKERAKRQAELEKRNNELFDSGEIGYGDFETLEGQAKDEEMQAKAEEDSAEYNSYSKEVFDVNFKRCQDDIGALLKLQDDVERLLRSSSAGANAVSTNDGDESLSQVMSLVLSVYQKLEVAYAEIVKAVAERDRRYKLTQTKPLYARGDIAGMKRVEKAFEDAEKKAEVRARVERAERCKRTWKMIEAEMERGAGDNEDFAVDVISVAEEASKSASDADKERVGALVDNAKKLVGAVYEDTMTLMRMFEQVDMLLNECEYEVSVASAKQKGDTKDYFERLEREKKKEDEKLRDDGEKRLSAVRTHRKEADGQLEAVERVLDESPEDRQTRERQTKALEEARRRNGQV